MILGRKTDAVEGLGCRMRVRGLGLGMGLGSGVVFEVKDGD